MNLYLDLTNLTIYQKGKHSGKHYGEQKITKEEIKYWANSKDYTVKIVGHPQDTETYNKCFGNGILPLDWDYWQFLNQEKKHQTVNKSYDMSNLIQIKELEHLFEMSLRPKENWTQYQKDSLIYLDELAPHYFSNTLPAFLEEFFKTHQRDYRNQTTSLRDYTYISHNSNGTSIIHGQKSDKLIDTLQTLVQEYQVLRFLEDNNIPVSTTTSIKDFTCSDLPTIEALIDEIQNNEGTIIDYFQTTDEWSGKTLYHIEYQLPYNLFDEDFHKMNRLMYGDDNA